MSFSDPAAYEKRKAKLDLAHANAIQVHAAYAALFNSENGKLVLEDLKKYAYYDRGTFVFGDPHATAKNEGRREVVLSILYMLDVKSSEAWADMVVRRDNPEEEE